MLKFLHDIQLITHPDLTVIEESYIYFALFATAGKSLPTRKLVI